MTVEDLKNQIDSILTILPHYAKLEVALFCGSINEVYNAKEKKILILYDKIESLSYNTNDRIVFLTIKIDENEK